MPALYYLVWTEFGVDAYLGDRRGLGLRVDRRSPTRSRLHSTRQLVTRPQPKNKNVLGSLNLHIADFSTSLSSSLSSLVSSFAPVAPVSPLCIHPRWPVSNTSARYATAFCNVQLLTTSAGLDRCTAVSRVDCGVTAVLTPGHDRNVFGDSVRRVLGQFMSETLTSTGRGARGPPGLRQDAHEGRAEAS